MECYERTLLANCLDPHNMGLLDDADGVGRVGEVTEGKFAIVFIAVEGERLAEVRYLVRGDCEFIAACSALSDLATGKTIAEARTLGGRDVALALGDSQAASAEHCEAVVIALRRALADYARRQGS